MRRTFFGQAIWGAGLELEELYRQNDAQHRAIRTAIASGSAEAARELAREHVLASGRLQEEILDHVGQGAQKALGDPG